MVLLRTQMTGEVKISDKACYNICVSAITTFISDRAMNLGLLKRINSTQKKSTGPRT